MPILSNPIKGLRDCPSPISSAKKRSYIIGKLIETDYFETGSTETICSAGPYSIAPGLKCSGFLFHYLEKEPWLGENLLFLFAFLLSLDLVLCSIKRL